MNIKDIKTAIMFLYSDDRQQVVLQCSQSKDFPYVKREVINLIGQPDKIIDNMLFYREGGAYKVIKVVSMTNESSLRGYREEDCFYVAHKDNKDWQRLSATAFWLDNRLDLGAYILTDSFGLIDAYNMLVRDGLTGDHALSCLSNEDFIKVEGIKAWEL